MKVIRVYTRPPEACKASCRTRIAPAFSALPLNRLEASGGRADTADPDVQYVRVASRNGAVALLGGLERFRKSQRSGGGG